MMAELIRSSMFCEIYDYQNSDYVTMQPEDTPTKSCDENVGGANCDNIKTIDSGECIQPGNNPNPTMKKVVQELQRSSGYDGGVIHHSDNAHNETIRRPTFMESDNDLLQTSMKIQPCEQHSYLGDDLNACVEYWTLIMLASKVELSTFSKLSPGSLFGDIYLNSIVRETTLNKVDKNLDKNCNSGCDDPNSDNDSKYSESNCDKIPYCNTAIVIAAIYTSGKKSLSATEIVDRIKEMFPECQASLPKKYRSTIVKCMRKTKYIVKNADDTFSISGGKVYMSIFCRRDHSSEMEKKYATLIQDHLGVPDMLKDIGFEVVISKKVQDNLLTSGEPNVGVGIMKNSSVKSRSVKSGSMRQSNQSASIKRKCEIEDDKSNKLQCLKLPVRPCFHDDTTDHEEDELLKLKELSKKDGNQTVQNMTAQSICPVQMLPAMVTPYQNLFTTDHHGMLLPMGSIQYFGWNVKQK